MKRLILGTMVLMACAQAFDGEAADDFALNGLKKNLANFSEKELGVWSLYEFDHDKYVKTHKDEFEFHGAVQDAYKSLIERLNVYPQKLAGRIYTINTGIEFGEYDFKNSRFPLPVLTKNSYFRVERGELFGIKLSGTSRSRLFFDNVDESKNFLPLSKEQASALIKSRKDSYSGRVDRELLARISYTFVDSKNENRSLGINVALTTITTAHLKKIEIIDGKNNDAILHTITYGD